MIMRYLISTICIALLLWGCDSFTAVPAKPKVVRKKIVAPQNNTAKVSTNKTVRKAKTKSTKTKLNYDGKSVTGQRLLINMGDIKLEQQIFFFNKKGETRVMILQDAPGEGGKNTQEFVNMRKLVQQTLSVDN